MTEVSLKLFFSYSHKDETLRDELADHLATLKREGVISSWHDRKILPGQEWDYQINDNLNTADIILLLVSSNFLASDYCWDVEVKKAIERHNAGEACVIPVILRPVDWKGAPFAKLQALPKNAEPVVSRNWHTTDEAFMDVAKGIRAAVEKLKQEREERQQKQEEIRLPRQSETEQKLQQQTSHQVPIPLDSSEFFRYFTDEAIKVIMLAQEEARRLGHNFIGTDQILLGLIGEGSGVAAKVLNEFGITLKDARREVEKIIGKGSGFVQPEVPFTPKVKRLFDQSVRYANSLGHNYISTEHLLLGLTDDSEATAAKVLQRMGVDVKSVRTVIIHMESSKL